LKYGNNTICLHPCEVDYSRYNARVLVVYIRINFLSKIKHRGPKLKIIYKKDLSHGKIKIQKNATLFALHPTSFSKIHSKNNIMAELKHASA